MAPSDHLTGFQPDPEFAQRAGGGGGKAGDFFRPCRDWFRGDGQPTFEKVGYDRSLKAGNHCVGIFLVYELAHPYIR